MASLRHPNVVGWGGWVRAFFRPPLKRSVGLSARSAHATSWLGRAVQACMLHQRFIACILPLQVSFVGLCRRPPALITGARQGESGGVEGRSSGAAATRRGHAKLGGWACMHSCTRGRFCAPCPCPFAPATEYCARGGLDVVLAQARTDPMVGAQLTWARRLQLVRRAGLQPGRQMQQQPSSSIFTLPSFRRWTPPRAWPTCTTARLRACTATWCACRLGEDSPLVAQHERGAGAPALRLHCHPSDALPYGLSLCRSLPIF